jgi:hypothetical protein
MIPVTYDKSYHEVCGDVTKYIIRTTKSINILRLCTWQKDRSYAFDWPKVEWSPPKHDDFMLRCHDLEGKFDITKPINIARDLRPSKNTDFPWISDQLVSKRSLVLYGRVWGTLAAQVDDVSISVLENMVTTRKVSVPAYSIDYDADKNAGTQPPFSEDLDFYREFVISKSSGVGRIFTKFEADNVEKDVLSWRCHGRASVGDIFVSLEPGPQNVILRKCSRSCDMFEVVGWHVPIMTGLHSNDRVNVWRHFDFHEYVSGKQAGNMLGPREQFEIR